jgi:hypothetical protein
LAEKFSREKGQIHFHLDCGREKAALGMKGMPSPHACDPEVATASEGPLPSWRITHRLLGSRLPAREVPDVFASRTDHARYLTLSIKRLEVPPGDFGATAKNRSGEAGIFGAFLFENLNQVAVACSALKNRAGSQISIAGKCLTLSDKTLFEQNTFGKCQNCEYLTLLTTFARDKCCD